MIVADASAAVAALLHAGLARERTGTEAVHVPHLVDVEVIAAIRRLALGSTITSEDGRRALAAWRRLGVTRYPIGGLVDRIWELRENVAAYDACYVALAETLDCRLVTADGRLAGAPGPRCSIELVPQ